MSDVLLGGPSEVKAVRLPVALWEALRDEAAVWGRKRNGYISQRLTEALVADRAERLRGERAEAERARLRDAGQGIYGG